jgi:hypothetical protein
MPQRIDSNARREIEVPSILDIPQPTAIPLYEHWWWTDVCRDHEGGLVVYQRRSCRIRRWVGIW